VLSFSQLIRDMLDGSVTDVKSYIVTNDLWQINDEVFLTDLCKRIMAEHPAAVSVNALITALGFFFSKSYLKWYFRVFVNFP